MPLPIVVLETVTPVFFVIALSFIIGKKIEIDIKTISFLAIYILTPALFFTSLVNTNITGGEFAQIFIFIVFTTFCIMVLVNIWTWAGKINMETKQGLLLSTVFPNSGNFGLPIVLVAFGALGFERGIIFAMLQNLLQNTLGVFFACNSHLSARQSLLKVARMPGFWALLLGLGLRGLNIMPPNVVMGPLRLIGQAAIPLTLITLGVQLSKIKLGAEPWFIGGASLIRLIAAPLIGFLFLYFFFDYTSLTSRVILLQAAGPVAATTTMLAIQFDSRPDIVSNSALITTVLSLLTVSVLLFFIMAL
jgi:malate permease and related proteins